MAMEANCNCCLTSTCCMCGMYSHRSREKKGAAAWASLRQNLLWLLGNKDKLDDYLYSFVVSGCLFSLRQLLQNSGAGCCVLCRWMLDRFLPTAANILSVGVNWVHIGLSISEVCIVQFSWQG